MPLYDHFHAPLDRRGWESFHVQWACGVADFLNRRLPRRFIAVTSINREPDYTSYRIDDVAVDDESVIVVEADQYTPPHTDLRVPADFPFEARVEVRDDVRGSRILGVIELVSPGNKEAAKKREQFVAKCLSTINHGIGLVMIDIVTGRGANLHNQMIRLAEHGPELEMAGDPPTYVSSYRPHRPDLENVIDMWHWPLVVGANLPVVPFALKGYGCVRLDLEATYAEACERSRIP